MKPVLIVDRNRSRSSAALELLNRCGIPAMAFGHLAEALALVTDRNDPPAAMLLDVATVAPLGARTRFVLRTLRASRPVHLLGLAPGGDARDLVPFLDACVAPPASAEEYRALLSRWCTEGTDRGAAASGSLDTNGSLGPRDHIDTRRAARQGSPRRER